MANMVGNTLNGIGNLGYATANIVDTFGFVPFGDDVAAGAVQLAATAVDVLGDVVNGRFNRACHKAVAGSVNALIKCIPFAEYVDIGVSMVKGETVSGLVGRKTSTFLLGEPKPEPEDNSKSAKFAAACGTVCAVSSLACFAKGGVNFIKNRKNKAGAPAIPGAVTSTTAVPAGVQVSDLAPLAPPIKAGRTASLPSAPPQAPAGRTVVAGAARA